MVLVVSGWLVSVLLLTKRLGKVQSNMEKNSGNLVMLLATTIPLLIFFTFLVNKVKEGTGSTIALAVSAIVMLGLQLLGKNPKFKWVLEWAIGIAMVVSMTVATLVAG